MGGGYVGGGTEEDVACLVAWEGRGGEGEMMGLIRDGQGDGHAGRTDIFLKRSWDRFQLYNGKSSGGSKMKGV